MKILHLTLKKKWFDMILSGEKKEEYRELKNHYFSRLLYKIVVPFGGYWNAKNDIEKGDYECKGWQEFTCGAPVYETFQKIVFRNGYANDAPQIIIECEGVSIGEGKKEWGFENTCFVISLGKIIETKNIK